MRVADLEFFSSTEEFVQGSTLLWPWLLLGPTYMLGEGPVLFVALPISWNQRCRSGLGFYWRRVRVLAGEIGQGVLLVLAVDASGDDAIGSVEALVMSGCQRRGGGGN